MQKKAIHLENKEKTLLKKEIFFFFFFSLTDFLRDLGANSRTTVELIFHLLLNFLKMREI